jgi:hypothetical protein
MMQRAQPRFRSNDPTHPILTCQRQTSGMWVFTNHHSPVIFTNLKGRPLFSLPLHKTY